MRSPAIDHFEAAAVFRGLLNGAGFRNRVAGSCVYGCPRCDRRIRFRWRSFYRAGSQRSFNRQRRRRFDQLTPSLDADEQGCLDFFCPGCRAPTRIIFCARLHSGASANFEVYAALVGEGKPAA